MSNPAEKAVNPANAKVDRKVDARSRVPMSAPERQLEVSDIPGYHLHWFLTSRTGRALRAGYTFVEEDEVPEGLNNRAIAGNANDSGNSDMGSRISVPAAVGGDSEERLYLMKIPTEWWEQDQDKLAERNEEIAAALRGGKPTGLGQPNPGDTSNDYVPGGRSSPMQSNLFTPKRPR